MTCLPMRCCFNELALYLFNLVVQFKTEIIHHNRDQMLLVLAMKIAHVVFNNNHLHTTHIIIIIITSSSSSYQKVTCSLLDTARILLSLT